MSEIKVNSIKGVGASAAAITVNNTDGTCTANITNNLSNRRLTINGAMQVCQRGDQTGISTAANNYTTDRFAIYENGGVAVSGLHQDSGTDLPEFPKCLRVDCTTASTYTNGHELKIGYEFEGQDLQLLQYGSSSNKKLTLSFYVRSNKAATYAIWFYRGVGNRQNGKTYTINSANTWEKKTITINGDASNAITNDVSSRMAVNWILMAGSDFTSGTNPNGTWETRVDANRYVGQTGTIGASTDDYFDLTGVQLEVGSVATDFEHRSFADELALCQRYYYQIVKGDNQAIGIANYWSSTEVRVFIPFPVTMRAAPTLSIVTNSNAYTWYRENGYDNTDGSDFAIADSHTQGCFIVDSGSSGTSAGNAAYFKSTNGNADMALTAEL